MNILIGSGAFDDEEVVRSPGFEPGISGTEITLVFLPLFIVDIREFVISLGFGTPQFF
jgi:hypothetical protein